MNKQEQMPWRESQYGHIHHSPIGIVLGSHVICKMNMNHPDYISNRNIILAANDMAEALLAARAIFNGMGINENDRIVGEQYSLIQKAIEKAGV